MKDIRFGIIGCGLMGREFASAAARWCHLPQMDARPTLEAVCDTTPEPLRWFTENFPSIRQTTTDYQALLSNPDVDAVYIAVPHNLHEKLYCDAINAGKHLMGEKPFGIDLAANEAILSALKSNPACFARCSSEFPFFPAMQRIGRMIEGAEFGTILEVNAGFHHSTDLDPQKPMNWKRTISANGEYGCLGDLGMHPLHVPLRAGWMPRNVRAILTRLYSQRPGRDGKPAPCETWDNATLLCESVDPLMDRAFPLTIKTQRIAPGEKNSWNFEILGSRRSARFSSKQANTLQLLDFTGGEQAWQHIDMGSELAFPSITGGIFECGFSDVILQMWAAFVHELAHGTTPARFAGCVTPEETNLHHKVLTAALESHRMSSVVSIA
ncbi:MAG: gfo/Idh/MocA family oxidoreductase [Verrucomicrobiaceae bacterium]|nr:MAG: gfo/Idh/MocA family oxidoreductase [Verrucomicrobiaceae bacterium]